MPRVSYGGIGPALLGAGNGYMATTQQNQENADTNAHNKAVIEGLTLQNMERKQQLASQQALQANLQKLGQFMSGMPASGPDHPGVPMATAGVLNQKAQGVDPNSTELGSAADTSIQTGQKLLKGADYADSLGMGQVASKMREDAKGLLTTGKDLAKESFEETQTETKELDQTLNGIKVGTKEGAAQYAAAMGIISKNPKLAALAAGENLTGDYGKDQQTLAVLQRRWLTQKDALTVDGENALHKAEAVHAYAGAAHENAETKKINTELAQGDGSGAGGLSTDAVNQAAMEKLMTGKEISGMGNASLAVKEKVRNAEAELIKKMGLTAAEAAMLPTNNKVKQKALGNMENWGAAVSKSVDQLDKTFDMAINLSKKLPLSDIQRINKMVIAGETEFGSGDAAAYGLAIQTVKSEYARMMSGPTSNAMTPVEAGRKADELISSQATPDQLPALKSVVMQEGKITKDSVKNQVDTLTESIDDPTGGRDKPQSSALSAADQDLISKYLKK